jgi:hypothetical protein
MITEDPHAYSARIFHQEKSFRDHGLERRFAGHTGSISPPGSVLLRFPWFRELAMPPGVDRC